MSALIVFIRQCTRVPSELEVYAQKAPASLLGHRIEFRALYGPHEVVEGPEIEGVAILESPSFAEAKQSYSGPEYSAAREHRLRGADYLGIIVEGVASAPEL